MYEQVNPRVQGEELRTMENNGLESHSLGAEPGPPKGTFSAPNVRALATGPFRDLRKVTHQQSVTCLLFPPLSVRISCDYRIPCSLSSAERENR